MAQKKIKKLSTVAEIIKRVKQIRKRKGTLGKSNSRGF